MNCTGPVQPQPRHLLPPGRGYCSGGAATPSALPCVLAKRTIAFTACRIPGEGIPRGTGAASFLSCVSKEDIWTRSSASPLAGGCEANNVKGQGLPAKTFHGYRAASRGQTRRGVPGQYPIVLSSEGQLPGPLVPV
jgi:hypothetical protein